MIAPPKRPADELELLIREARERQLRRRLLAAAGVALAAALGLGVYAFVTGGSLANVAQPPAAGGRPTGPACRGSQLSVSVFFQGATQMMIGGATLTNTSDAACSLPAIRPAVRISEHGRPLLVREQGLTGSFLPTTWKPARVLTPGTRAEVLLDWGRLNWDCGRSARPTPRFVLRFSTGLELTGIASGLILPACGVRDSALGVSRPLLES